MSSSHSPDRLAVDFDDDHAVANAGLLLAATLAHRLGIEQVVDELVDLGDRPSTLGTFPRAFTFGTSASSTGSPRPSWVGRGQPVPDPVRRR